MVAAAVGSLCRRLGPRRDERIKLDYQKLGLDMNNKLMAGGHEAWRNEAFELESLESRTFLSGTQAMLAYGEPVTRVATARPQVMEATHYQHRVARADGQLSIANLNRGSLQIGRNEPAPQIRFDPVRAARVFIRHISIGVGIDINRFGPPAWVIGGVDWTGGQVAFPPGRHFPIPSPDFSAPSDEPAAPSDQPDAPSSGTNPSLTQTGTERGLNVLATGSANVDAQIAGLAATEVVTAPAARLSSLGISSRAADVVHEVLATATTAAGRHIAAVGKLQSALLMAPVINALPSSQSMRWIAPDAQVQSAPTGSQATGSVAATTHDQRPMVSRLASMIMPSKMFDFARFGDPLAMLYDPLATFADESAGVSSSLVSTTLASGSASAWSVTAAVIAADVVLLTYFYRKGRRSRQPFRGRDLAWQAG
jgi:hypothetical protein